MTTSMAESFRKDTELQEVLPTSYEQSPQSPLENVLQAVPDEDATPDKARDYLVQLLVTKRALATDHAQCIADRWTIGTGKELRSYPPDMYFEVFRREDGWKVYREVKTCVYEEQIGTRKASKVCFAMVIFALTGVIGFGMHWNLQESGCEGYKVAFAIAVLNEALGARPPEAKVHLQRKLEQALLEHRIECELQEATSHDPRGHWQV